MNTMPLTLETPEKLRARRVLQIFGVYWFVVLLAALLLPLGRHPELATHLITLYMDFFSGPRRIAERSFDHYFVESLLFLTLSWSLVLSLLAVVWLPRQSHISYASGRLKAIQIVGSSFALLVAWVVPFVMLPEATYSLEDGRTSALLYLATSSRLGAALVLGCFFGFAHLLFFIMVFASFIVPIRSVAAIKQKIERGTSAVNT